MQCDKAGVRLELLARSGNSAGRFLWRQFGAVGCTPPSFFVNININIDSDSVEWMVLDSKCMYVLFYMPNIHHSPNASCYAVTPYNTQSNLLESDLPRETEASAEHLLVWADQANIVNGKIEVLVASAPEAILRRDGVSNALRDALADIHMVVVLVRRVSRETIHMDHGQLLLRMRREQRLLTRVNTRECIEELNRVRGEVHNVVVHDLGTMIHLRRGKRRLLLLLRASSLLLRPRLKSNRHRLGLEQLPRRRTDKRPSVLVPRRHKLVHLIPLHRVQHHLVSVRVEVIRPHKDLLLARRHGERSHARHHVADHLAGAELVHETPVLRLQTAVPVHAGVVKAELAVLLMLDDIEIRFAGEDLEGEGAEFADGADVLSLADDGPDAGVLVEEDFGDDLFEGEVLFAEVKVRYFASVLGS